MTDATLHSHSDIPLPADEAAEPGETGAAQEADAFALQLALQQKDEEIARLKDSYLRAMADTENLRARSKRELEDSNKYASAKFARDMVNIVENLGRAAQSVTPEARQSSDILKQVGGGLDMTMQELLGIFERNGITRIDPMGEKFDHNFHQAVAQVPSPGVAPGTVLQVLQAGYVLHDRLLRPAMVTVAAAGSPAPHVDTSA